MIIEKIKQFNFLNMEGVPFKKYIRFNHMLKMVPQTFNKS